MHARRRRCASSRCCTAQCAGRPLHGGRPTGATGALPLPLTAHLSACLPAAPQVKEEEQEAAKLTAVFPCVLKIIPTCIFNQKVRRGCSSALDAPPVGSSCINLAISRRAAPCCRAWRGRAACPRSGGLPPRPRLAHTGAATSHLTPRRCTPPRPAAGSHHPGCGGGGGYCQGRHPHLRALPGEQQSS